jgi:preprotein translocase subunit SecG
MFQIIFTIHIVLCLILVGLVLLQQGKGADAGAIVGGGSDSVFGAGSAGSFVSKLTTGLAIAFMITSILMVKLYQERAFVSVDQVSPLKGSVLETVKTETAPVVDAKKTDEQAVDATKPVEKTVSDETKAVDTSAKATNTKEEPVPAVNPAETTK